MVIKHGRYGKFIACSGYPECKTTKPITLGIACPEPGCPGQLVARRSRRGRPFYGCSAYPSCTFVLWQRPVPEPCPKCGALFLTERPLRGRVCGVACARTATSSARSRRRRMTELAQRFLRYLSVEQHASPHTLRAYRTDLEDFRRFCAEASCAYVAGVDGRLIRAYLAQLHRRGLDPVT